jgi:hypothetical protein
LADWVDRTIVGNPDDERLAPAQHRRQRREIGLLRHNHLHFGILAAALVTAASFHRVATGLSPW